MEARRRLGLGALWGLWAGLFICQFATEGWAQPRRGETFRSETANFIITASDRTLVQQVAHQAERYRKELAIEWLGHELPPWTQKCPIEVHLGGPPSGVTVFAFAGPPDARYPIEWDMKIYGPADRLLDAVLPHEITHTIFATHFGQPLPRWADEGACTTVEHEIERQKIQSLLIQFLSAKPTKGIPFNQLFPMMQYPDEMLPLYAQSYSLAKFLILQRGRREFIRFVETGLAQSQIQPGLEALGWGAAVQQHYGYRDLSDLQVTWVRWVKAGSPDELGTEYVALASPETDLAVGNDSPADANAVARLPGNWPVATNDGLRNSGSEIGSALASGLEPQRPWRDESSGVSATLEGNSGGPPSQTRGGLEVIPAQPNSPFTGGWYRQQMRSASGGATPTTSGYRSSSSHGTTRWR